jgi:uncharacterized membrane protein
MTIFDPFYSSLYALGFRDPIHPPLTHITIGVVAAALVFGLLAWVWRQPFLARAARYCLVMAWVSLFPTVLLGLMDWQHWYQGGWPQPIFIKICLAACLFLVLSLGMILVVTGRVESRALPAIYLVAFFTVMGLGYFGGRLVFGGRAPAVPPKLEAGRRLFQNHCMACHPNLGNAILPDMTIIGSDGFARLPCLYPGSSSGQRPKGAHAGLPGPENLRRSGQRAICLSHRGFKRGKPSRSLGDRHAGEV